MEKTTWKNDYFYSFLSVDDEVVILKDILHNDYLYGVMRLYATCNPII